jgi:hypothetical protein
MSAYFPKDGVKIFLILWNGIRNGNAHLFMPKIIKVNDTFLKFAFFVKMSQYQLSYVSKSNNIIHVHINVIEFYRVFKKALQDYKTSVEESDALQDNFINAGESIDNTPQELTTDKNKIPKDVRRLNSRLQFSKEVNIFSNPHNGLLSSSYYHDKSHQIAKLIRLISLAL